MYLSDSPVGQPGACPMTGSSKDPEGFYILGLDEGQTLSLSGGAVRHLVREFGHASKEDHADALDKLATVTAENAQLRSELEEARQTLAAIDALESAGFRARNKPGPKPKVAGV